MKLTKLIPAIIIIFIIGILVFFLFPENEPVLGDVHNHADIAVFLNDEQYDFNQSRYMSEKDNLLNPFMHLHDNDGDVLHQHISDGSLAEFFRSIGMEFSEECFALDNGSSYCNDGTSKLRMFVNGKENFEYGNYVFNDLDRILITYGNDDETIIKQQRELLTDKACIQSGKCPERGSPSDESDCTSEGGCIAV